MTQQPQDPSQAGSAADAAGPEQPKISRANIRKINKVATGPLLGTVQPLPKRASTGELAARVAPLGGILSVRARLSASLEGDGKPN